MAGESGTDLPAIPTGPPVKVGGIPVVYTAKIIIFEKEIGDNFLNNAAI